MKDYYIGLDIGTNSIGWSCVDEDYNLLKFNRKHMWGVRLINSVDTASERKTFRSNRRRLERRKRRCLLLQELLEADIIKCDPNFFRRLEYSYLIPNDISRKEFGKQNVNILFDDNKYTDKDFFKKYPTIYHLRHAMINSTKKFDIREIYLVLHHMIKYRGNFLYEGSAKTFTNDVDLSTCIINLFNFEFSSDETDNLKAVSLLGYQIDKIIQVIKDDSIPKFISHRDKNSKILTKEDTIIKFLSEDKQVKYSEIELKKVSNIIRAILGYNFNLNEILDLEYIDDDQTIYKIKFDDNYFDRKETICELLSGEEIEYLNLLESCYSAFILKNIMGDNKYLCDAKIDTYNEHKEDLKLLKHYIKGLCNSINSFALYDAMFRDVLEYKNNETMAKIGCPYSMYVKNQQNVKHKNQLYTGCSQELFYTFVRNIISVHLYKDAKAVKLFNDNFGIDLSGLSGVKDQDLVAAAQTIISKMDKNEFMLKLNDISNSMLPYQLNLIEMQIILRNQAKYYSSIKENADKIESILTFNRPYYVGVLNPNSSFSWAKDDQGNSLVPNERIYPWNFDELIDKEAFANQFMKKLVGKCTYFNDEDVLSKRSIRYQALCTLNELNKVRIADPGTNNFKLINTDLKKYLFKELFLNYKTVSVKRLILTLKEYDENKYKNITENNIRGLSQLREKGINAEFSNNMSSYVSLKNIFGDQFNIGNIDIYEEIIKIVAIFQDKEVIKARISKMYALEVSEEQLNKLTTLKADGWGRFSKKLLDGIVDKNGNTILEDLYYGKHDIDRNKDVGYNLDELLFDKELGFKEQVFDVNGIENNKINFNKHIKPLYCSPNVKSILWQTILIVEEIIKITKKQPLAILVESTKEDSMKVQSKTRFEHLLELYQRLPQTEELKCLYTELLNNEERIHALDDKVYLYFVQLGKCMYTQERLNLSQLNDYEIDHIIPRCIIKDDSFSNRVLVKKEENQRKSKSFVLDDVVIQKCKKWWHFLKDNDFISNKKYQSLIRDSYSVGDIEGFINRQLVETNQIVKSFRQVLSKIYPIENIIGVKASLISQFRIEQMLNGKAGFAKIRDLNDLHHAKDAYLVAALGAFATYLLRDRDVGIFTTINNDLMEKAKNIREVKSLINQRNGYILNALEYENYGKNKLIDKEFGSTIQMKYETIVNTMKKNDCLVTKKIQKISNGAFYKATKYGRNRKCMKLIPIRCCKTQLGEVVPLDTSFYGGYSYQNFTCCMIAKFTKKNKKVEYKIINLSRMDYQHQKEDNNYMAKKLTENHKLRYSKVEIYKECIPKNQLVTLNGQWLYVVSAKEYNNAVQLVLDKQYDQLLYFISKYNFVGKNRNIDTICGSRMQQLYHNMEENEGIIDELIKHYIFKINNLMPIYRVNIDDYALQEKLNNYSWDEKCNIVKELMKATKCNGAKTDDIKDIVGVVHYGRIYDKSIVVEEAIFKYNSITGLYSKEINILN